MTRPVEGSASVAVFFNGRGAEIARVPRKVCKTGQGQVRSDQALMKRFKSHNPDAVSARISPTNFTWNHVMKLWDVA